MVMQDEIDRAEWAKTENWRGGWLGIYRSAKDSRAVVPKRNAAMGWTFNTGHPVGLGLTAGALGLALGAVAWGIGRRR